MFEEAAVHEAGHAVIWVLEEKYVGPLALVSALPYADATGRVRGTGDAPSRRTPRTLRASGYVNAAGLIAERLAGFQAPDAAGSRDLLNLDVLGWLSKRGPRFVAECRAGAELMLRSHWTAVEKVAGYLKDIGELKPPYARELVRMALGEPQRVLASDLKTFIRLCATLEDVPEFVEQFTAIERTLSAQVA